LFFNIFIGITRHFLSDVISVISKNMPVAAILPRSLRTVQPVSAAEWANARSNGAAKTLSAVDDTQTRESGRNGLLRSKSLDFQENISYV
jgi:hypothetical protein